MDINLFQYPSSRVILPDMFVLNYKSKGQIGFNTPVVG